MQTIRTIRCKLTVQHNDIKTINDLFNHYAAACSEIAQYGRDHKEDNAVRLHHALYYAIRKKYGLPANLVVTALRRAAGTLKTAKMRGKFEFRPTFIALDERTFTFKLDKSVITFSTHEGRKIATLDIGDYQREALKSGHVQMATLVRTREGVFYANIVVRSEVEDSKATGILGVDLGIRNVAVTSTGKKLEGKSIREYREHRWKIRASLQSHGTRGAKKVLRRLSGKEARHAAWINHNIAKIIVEDAVKTGCSLIRMEELKGIRERTRIPNKHRNRMMSLWSFFQLQAFVAYKAAMRGIATEWINPAYTSQTCHQCKKRGLRDRETFVCTTCDITMDADENAAKVIAGGAVVNRPESTGHREAS